MTEREKRIEEMKEVGIDVPCLWSCSTCEDKCRDYEILDRLYDAGYRKADEVEKKTAKDIRDMLMQRLNGQKNMLLRLELAAMIVKIETVFGVEVSDE